MHSTLRILNAFGVVSPTNHQSTKHAHSTVLFPLLTPQYFLCTPPNRAQGLPWELRTPPPAAIPNDAEEEKACTSTGTEWTQFATETMAPLYSCMSALSRMGIVSESVTGMGFFPVFVQRQWSVLFCMSALSSGGCE